MGKTTIKAVDKSIGDLLWTGSGSSTSGFSINIGASKYTHLLIYACYIPSDGSNNDQSGNFIRVGTKSAIIAVQPQGATISRRRVTFSNNNNTITFSNGYMANRTTEYESDIMCIPMKIYGIK